MDEKHCTLRIRGTGKSNTVYVRQHKFTVGETLHFDKGYDQITGLEHFLGALGADVVGVLGLVTRKNRLAVDEVEAVVSATVNNPLTYLGVVGEEGSPSLKQVSVKVFVSSLEAEDEVRGAWEQMLIKAPIVNTLKSAVKLELEMKQVL